MIACVRYLASHDYYYGVAQIRIFDETGIMVGNLTIIGDAGR